MLVRRMRFRPRIPGFERHAFAWLLVWNLTLVGAAAAVTPVTDLRALYADAPRTWPAAQVEPGVTFVEFGPLPDMAEPPPRPLAALGQRLFEDPRLSGSGQIACASCHNRELAFADGVSRSFGHDRKRLTRNAPSLWTARWMERLFWDGRADTLEAQALMPIQHADEMRGDLAVVEQRLRDDPVYAPLFAEAFGDPRIDRVRLSQALAAFQRTLKPRRARFDRFLATGPSALTDQELLGLQLFRTKAGCVNCHNGPLFSDQKFHNLGLGFYGRANQDLGRFAVTGAAGDVGAFRTPSLRGVAHSAPYMHNGGIPTLEAAVAFYAAGAAHPRPRPDQAGDPLFPKTSPLVKPRELTAEERAALVAFLKTL